MAFRGYGDDALKVKENKRQHAAKMAQIAAQERASMRAADSAQKGLDENARQADMRDSQATAALEANVEAGEASRGLEQEKLSMSKDSMASAEQARGEQLKMNLATQAREDRKLQMNEEMFTRAEAEHQKMLAAQEAYQDKNTSAKIALYRAASVASAPLGMPYLNMMNDTRGVAYGDPGSLTQAFPIIDPNTEARLGVGTVEIGEDGKEIQSVLDPNVFLKDVVNGMSPDKAETFLQGIISGNKAGGHDRYTVAAQREIESLKTKLEDSQPKLTDTFSKFDPIVALNTVTEQVEDIQSDIQALEKKHKGKEPFRAPAHMIKRHADLLTVQQQLLDRTTELTAPRGAPPGPSAPERPEGQRDTPPPATGNTKAETPKSAGKWGPDIVDMATKLDAEARAKFSDEEAQAAYYNEKMNQYLKTRSTKE